MASTYQGIIKKYDTYAETVADIANIPDHAVVLAEDTGFFTNVGGTLTAVASSGGGASNDEDLAVSGLPAPLDTQTTQEGVNTEVANQLTALASGTQVYATAPTTDVGSPIAVGTAPDVVLNAWNGTAYEPIPNDTIETFPQVLIFQRLSSVAGSGSGVATIADVFASQAPSKGTPVSAIVSFASAVSNNNVTTGAVIAQIWDDSVGGLNGSSASLSAGTSGSAKNNEDRNTVEIPLNGGSTFDIGYNQAISTGTEASNVYAFLVGYKY